MFSLFALPEDLLPFRLLAIDIRGRFSVETMRAAKEEEIIQKIKERTENSWYRSFALYNRVGTVILSHMDPTDEKTFPSFVATAQGRPLH